MKVYTNCDVVGTWSFSVINWFSGCNRCMLLTGTIPNATEKQNQKTNNNKKQGMKDRDL